MPHMRAIISLAHTVSICKTLHVYQSDAAASIPIGNANLDLFSLRERKKIMRAVAFENSPNSKALTEAHHCALSQSEADTNYLSMTDEFLDASLAYCLTFYF